MATKETTTIVIMTSACFADPGRVRCLLDILERTLAPTKWGTDPDAREPYRREAVIELATEGRDARAIYLARRRPAIVACHG